MRFYMRFLEHVLRSHCLRSQNEVHYVNGVADGTSSCSGDLTQNDYPFKVGARARGTGMATSSDTDASAITDNGSRFFVRAEAIYRCLWWQSERLLAGTGGDR